MKIALVLAFTLAACGSKAKPSTTTDDHAAGSGAATPGTAPAGAAAQCHYVADDDGSDPMACNCCCNVTEGDFALTLRSECEDRGSSCADDLSICLDANGEDADE